MISTGSPTFGAQVAAIVQFVVIMTLLGPLTGVLLPNGTSAISGSLYASIYGTNGILSATSSNFTTVIVNPLITQANSSSGFGASSGLQTFSGLAFIYGAMNLAWKSFTNFPKILYIIFTSLGSSTGIIPLSILSIASIGIFSYVLLGDFFKVLSMWMKSDAENIGA